MFPIQHALLKMLINGGVAVLGQQTFRNVPQLGKKAVVVTNAAIQVTDQNAISRGLQCRAQIRNRTLQFLRNMTFSCEVTHAHQEKTLLPTDGDAADMPHDWDCDTVQPLHLGFRINGVADTAHGVSPEKMIFRRRHEVQHGPASQFSRCRPHQVGAGPVDGQ